MIKRAFLYLGAILLLLLISLWLLYSFATLSNDSKNGFTRKWAISKLTLVNEAKIDASIDRICGISESTIFLAGTFPKAMLMLNKNLYKKDTLLIKMQVSLDKTVPYILTVDSPMLYLHLNNLKSILYGKFPGQNLNQTEINSEIFTKSLQLSPNTLVLRTFSPTTGSQIFKKIDIGSRNTLKENPIIEVDSNDLMSLKSDGMLLYEKHTAKILFINYFKNKFSCIDTNLNLIYTGSTIDTNKYAKIETGIELNKDNGTRVLPTKARVLINRYSFTNNNLIFVASGLKADNEDLKTFNNNDVIDIYKISSGAYLGSFYLPKYELGSIQSAIFYKNSLVVLYKGKIAVYTLTIKGLN